MTITVEGKIKPAGMFAIRTTRTIAAAHYLNLDYPSKCVELHGHNFKVIVLVQGKELNTNGMVVDFKVLHKIIDQYDHKSLNSALALYINPTAENLARAIGDEINQLGRSTEPPFFVSWVKILETEGNEACYIP